jgi:hypothetical protein
VVLASDNLTYVPTPQLTTREQPFHTKHLPAGYISRPYKTLELVNLPLELCGARLRSYRALNAHTPPQQLLWDYVPKYLLVSLSKDTTLTYVAELMQESSAK